MELYRAICDRVTLGLLLFVPGHGTYRRFRLGDENPTVRKQRRYQLAIALHKPRGPVRSREVFHRFRKDSNDGCFPQTHRSLMIAGRYVGEKRLNHQERRKLARLPLGVFVRIRPSGQNPELGETLNVSPRGLYLHTRARLQPGQELECVLVLPEMLTHAPAPMLVECRGRVVRVNERLPGQQLGAALEIYSYDFSWPSDQLESS